MGLIEKNPLKGYEIKTVNTKKEVLSIEDIFSCFHSIWQVCDLVMFANYAVKNNMNLFHISKLLGHTKLATTEHYLRDFFQKEQTDVMNNLFGQ